MQIKNVIIGSAVNTAKYITLPKVHCERFLFIADKINPTKDTIKGTASVGIAIANQAIIAKAVPRFSGAVAISTINQTTNAVATTYKTAVIIFNTLKLLLFI